MHDEAIRAAVAGMKKAEPWSEFWDDNDAEALAHAAITAFLERVDPATLVPVMQETRLDGARVRFSDAYGEVLARAMLAQLRREL